MLTTPLPVLPPSSLASIHKLITVALKSFKTSLVNISPDVPPIRNLLEWPSVAEINEGQRSRDSRVNANRLRQDLVLTDDPVADGRARVRVDGYDLDNERVLGSRGRHLGRVRLVEDRSVVVPVDDDGDRSRLTCLQRRCTSVSHTNPHSVADRKLCNALLCLYSTLQQG